MPHGEMVRFEEISKAVHHMYFSMRASMFNEKKPTQKQIGDK